MKCLMSYLKRLKNPATIIGIASSLTILLSEFGVPIDDDHVMTVVRSVASIFVLLGIMNNPDTDGFDLPIVMKRKKKK